MIYLLSIFSRVLRWISAKNLENNYRSKIQDAKDRGMAVGKNVVISPAARIDENYPYLISIGDNCVIGPNVRLLAHDSTFSQLMDGHMRLGRIEIRENCILCMNSIVLPGVTIGPNVLVASGSVVNKTIPPNSCVAGVPARFYAKFDDYVGSLKKDLESRPVIEAVDLAQGEDEMDPERKRMIMEGSRDGYVYIKGIESKYPIWIPTN